MHFSTGTSRMVFLNLLLNENIITLEVYEIIPAEVLAANKIVVLDLTASAPNAETAIALIVLDVIENETPPSEQLFLIEHNIIEVITLTANLNSTK